MRSCGVNFENSEFFRFLRGPKGIGLRQSTRGTGHIPICTHGPNLHLLKHIGRPMSGLFTQKLIYKFQKRGLKSLNCSEV